VRKAVELGLLNTLSYAILTVDFRSVAQANYPVAFVVNLVIAFLTVTILKRVVAASTRSEMIAYMLSGGFGTVIGIAISQHILGR
jgi:hypothetical protein